MTVPVYSEYSVEHVHNTTVVLKIAWLYTYKTISVNFSVGLINDKFYCKCLYKILYIHKNLYTN